MKLKSENLLKVINNFKKMTPFVEKGKFDINEPHVSSKRDGHQCGTVHCVAGWYLLAREWDGKSFFLKLVNRICGLRSNKDISYEFGILAIYEDLKLGPNLKDDDDHYAEIEIHDAMEPYWWDKFKVDDMFYSWRGYLDEEAEDIEDVEEFTWELVIERWEEAYNNLKKEETYEIEKQESS